MWSGVAVAGDYPVTLKDGRGKDVTLSQKPEKVAALWVAAADLLVALGRPVAGITTYEGERPVYLGKGLDNAKDLGDITAPNLEMIATTDLDLTIGMTRYNAVYADEIEKSGPLLTYDAEDIDASLKAVAKLGRALGAAEQADKMNADFLALRKDYAAKAPKKAKSVLFIWSYQDTLYGYQDNIMTAQLVGTVGTVNPLGRNEDAESPDAAFVSLEAEQLLALDPDVILMFVSHGGAVKFSPVYERLKAYKNNKIYSVGYQYSQPSGPIARELVVREAAHLIYPDIFEKPFMPDAARAKPIQFAQ